MGKVGETRDGVRIGECVCVGGCVCVFVCVCVGCVCVCVCVCVCAFVDEVGEVPGGKVHGMKHDSCKMLFMVPSGKIAASGLVHLCVCGFVWACDTGCVAR